MMSLFLKQRAQAVRCVVQLSRHRPVSAVLCRDNQRRLSSSSSISCWWKDNFESSHGSQIEVLPEQVAVMNLQKFLNDKCETSHSSAASSFANKSEFEYEMTPSKVRITLDAAMATFCLHVHARIASMVGQGFYTIGPCGEELLSSAALALEKGDSTSLHYRHSGMQLARQLEEQAVTFEDLLLDRARGYTVSRYDPVTGGVHCAIGEGGQIDGDSSNFLVTSTLASQCPPAVGRALGYSLVERLKEEQMGSNLQDTDSQRPISFCTIGDGSAHHGHFWSALTLARHARHRNIKCPLVMGISNNGLSISYATKNHVETLFPQNGSRLDEPQQLKVYKADGQDMMDVYDQTMKATSYARLCSAPAIVLYQNLVRRFGHAATDRQHAYLDPELIRRKADTDVLSRAMIQAVEDFNILSYPEVRDRWEEIQLLTDQAFAKATQEPKVTLEDMMERVAAPLATVESSLGGAATDAANAGMKCIDVPPKEVATSTTAPREKPQVMRKHMTRVMEEIMSEDNSVVYLGEDVEHGGYYLVTDGLEKKFPGRVIDFPPDETSLLGAGLGFSQLGLTPIVEIPYAKYLDCGVDMFYEIGLYHWVTNNSHNNGMVIRLQGFDRGLFGGNFHTHNMLSHIPPGVDVVCFSNGHDYVQGFRHAVKQAKAGRVVVSVDCTHLLNLRHLHDDIKDRGWETPYPSLEEEKYLGFDEIRRYRYQKDTTNRTARLAVVSYGNGVVTALQARRSLVERGILSCESEMDILDCPYISGVPNGLEEVLPKYDNGVVFADICKEGPGSNVFSSMIASLQQKHLLPSAWTFVGAPRTYNPLGSYVTFLNREMIEEAVEKVKVEESVGKVV